VQEASTKARPTNGHPVRGPRAANVFFTLENAAFLRFIQVGPADAVALGHARFRIHGTWREGFAGVNRELRSNDIAFRPVCPNLVSFL
jgi:hypothetical protein